MDNRLRVYGSSSNTYIRFDPVRDILEELEYMEQINHFYIDNENEVMQKKTAFELLYEYEKKNERKYINKKAQNRQAVKLTFLLPYANLRINKLLRLRNSLLKTILGKHYNLTLSYVERKGKARYLVILISEREYYSKLKTVKVYASRDMYVDRTTKKFCKSDHANAELIALKGTLLRSEQLQFSKTKFRIFTRQKQEWILYLRQLHRLYINCLENINVISDKLYCYNKIDLRMAKNRYQQWKIYKYNTMITSMNIGLDELYSFIYSPACYYQEYEVTKQFKELFYKYKARLDNKCFHIGKVRYYFDLNTYYKHYNDNLKEFYNIFIDEVYSLKKNIALSY